MLPCMTTQYYYCPRTVTASPPDGRRRRKEASTRDLVAVIQGRGLLSFLGETALAQGDIAFRSLLSPWCGFGAHDTGCGREGDEARGGD